MPTSPSDKRQIARIDDLIRVVSGDPPSTFGGTPSPAPAARMAMESAGYQILQGVVIRSGERGYDCVVKSGHNNYSCAILTTMVSNGFGVMDGWLPVEGTNVVILTRGGSSAGWVIGAIPRSLYVRPSGWDMPWQTADYPNEDMSPYLDNIAWNIPYKDEDRFHRLWSSSNRPHDIIPGESFALNENHVGTRISMYDVELSGGSCFIRLSRIDDEIRMRSTNYTKWTDESAVSEFNDGGYLSAEGRGYSYQHEAMGDPGTSIKFSGYEKPSETKDKEPRPRTRFWRGFLGNLLSWFVVRPRKSKSEDDYGLVSVHASQAGNVMVRAAGGVSLERYDRIPVPHRLKETWEKDGDRETQVSHKAVEKFVSKDPHARGLELSSKMAWDQASMYKRFDELKKDFKVQSEQEVKPLKDEDEDPFGSKEIKFSEYRDRRAGVFIGDDGSVILRDAWGSEIVMLGGNVTINTPGSVSVTAHNDIVNIAGFSFVARGKKAADVSADDGIARLHAKRLVEIAGGTDSTDGGVLIEAIAKGASIDAKEDAGDSASVKGVVVRSEESSVSVSGKSAYVLGKENVFVTSGEDGGDRSGNVLLNGGNVLATASNVFAGVTDGNGVIAANGAAVLHSKGSSLVSGEGSSMIVNGQKVPILWDGEADMSKVSDIMTTIQEALQPSDIEKPFTWDELKEKAKFSFRKSSDAKTDSGREPWRPNSEFRVYEPYWQVMKDTGDPMAPKESPEEIGAEEVHGTKCWPGKSAFDGGKIVKLSGSGNLSSGYSKARDSLQSSVEVTTEPYSSFKL